MVQTARWLLRPIAFLEDCRRRFGDPFGIHLVGFRSPLFMVSDPDVIRALYGDRRNGLPPGRSAALLPMVGPRSLLLLEGADHLARRRLMLPPFHGERMRAYALIVREAAEAEMDRWPSDAVFPLHPSMQAITLEVILRAVFGVTDEERRARLADRLRQLLDATSSPALQFAVLLARRVGRFDPLARLQAMRREIDALLLAEIAERRADPDAERRDDILSMLVGARFEDGSGMSDAELRDQLMTLLLAGHETTATALAWTFDLLSAIRRRSRGGRGGRRRRAGVRARGHRRVAAAASGGGAGRAAARGGAANRRRDAAAGQRRDARHLAHAHAARPLPRAVRVPPGALPRPGARDLRVGAVRRRRAALPRRRVRGVRDARGDRGGAAPLHAAAGGPHAEHVTRRNVTFSPRNGTRVHATPRSATRRRVARERA